MSHITKVFAEKSKRFGRIKALCHGPELWRNLEKATESFRSVPPLSHMKRRPRGLSFNV